MARPHDHRFEDPRLAYIRDPMLGWIALVTVFALLVVILGLALGHTFAARRAAMLSFVNDTYQVVNTDQPAAQRPIRVILAQ